MKKIIYNRFPKDWMTELPKVTYDKNIFVIVTPPKLMNHGYGSSYRNQFDYTEMKETFN